MIHSKRRTDVPCRQGTNVAIRMAPTPTSEASTSTINCLSGSGVMMMGAEVNNPLSRSNASCEALDQPKRVLDKVKLVSGDGDTTIISDKTMIKIGKPLKHDSRIWNRLINDSTNLVRVHADPLCRNHRTEKRDRLGMNMHFSALTNRWFSSKRCKNSADMLHVYLERR